jgi:hypothetical protein
MKLRLWFVAAVVVVAVLSATAGFAAGAQAPTAPGAASADAKTPPAMAMMKMHEQMMAGMKADEARLDALLKEINAASGDARIAALIAAVNEIVRQQKAERAHMAGMHAMMAEHHAPETTGSGHVH